MNPLDGRHGSNASAESDSHTSERRREAAALAEFRRHSRHPGLQVILEKLHRGDCVAEDEYRLLSSFLHESSGVSPQYEDAGMAEALPSASPRGLISGQGTACGAQRLAGRCVDGLVDSFTPAQGRLVSSIGIGTYRGAGDVATDHAYAAAVGCALAGGVNLIDSSLNYRHQRSERAVGMAIRRFVEFGGGARDEIVVCSKGGFLVPGAVPSSALADDDVVGGCHSMAPDFLADQIERSRHNLGVETIDVYYLHNPEVQLQFVDVAVR